MRAAQYSEHGGPGVLQVVSLPDPAPGPGDVVVRVEAASLNRLDVVQRNGWFTLDGFALPHVAGMDVAGTVHEVGAEVDSVGVGDRVVVDPSLAGVADNSKLAGRGDLYGELGVIGATDDGGYAELCLVPASHVYSVPDSMAIEYAATFPTCHLTASHAMFDVAGLAAGETVMIHAAGSGVSVAAIQQAKQAGCTVLATAGSQPKLDRAIEIGAAHVLNNRSGDVTGWAYEVPHGRGVDVVLDHVGTALFEPSLFALAVGGRIVSCGNTSGDAAAIPSLGFMFHRRASILGSDAYRPDEFAPAWSSFCDGVAAGTMQVHIETEYPLDGAADAQEQLLSGDVFGKIVLRPQSDS